MAIFIFELNIVNFDIYKKGKVYIFKLLYFITIIIVKIKI
ncbi:hypothetical protein NIASO_13055 [Niabella soli DSM 19437]|uniref:Uncharacterized protein n=1 Tax=Niabella soli DSM 19437 TaxID=929713 RepID=W0F8N9_9BACT|nr:hypothetical protein NIASO_13055 [Niabella soli DSM 19437]